MPVLDIVVAALSMVLLVSGVLKVRDPEATTPMLRATGLPASHLAVLAVAGAEIVVGAVTLVIGGAAATAVLAALYASFAVVSLVLLRSDDEVPCGCFGQRSASVSPVHVAVNALAAVVAGVAAALGAQSLFAPADDRSGWVVALAVVAAGLVAALVVALLTGVIDRFTTGTDGPPSALTLGHPTGAGATARASNGGSGGTTGVIGLVPVVGLTPAGDRAEVAVAGTGRVTLLAFLTSGCTTCSRFWDTFAAVGGVTLPGAGTELVIVTRGDDQENPNRVRDLAPADHLVVRSSAAWADYGVAAGPYFVLVDGRRDVILGEGAATAWADVVTLTRQAVRSAGVAE